MSSRVRAKATERGSLELPLVPLFSSVIYPSDVSSFTIHLPGTKKILETASEHEGTVVLYFMQSPEAVLTDADLPAVCLKARILSKIAMPKGSYQVNLQGLKRALIAEIVRTEPFPTVKIQEIKDRRYNKRALRMLANKVIDRCQMLAEADERYSVESIEILRLNLEDPGRLADMVAGAFSLQLQGRRRILELVDVEERLRALIPLLDEELKKSTILAGIVRKAKSGIEEGERRELLRKQLEVIKTELGEESPQQIQAKENTARLEASPLPEEVKRHLRREVDRLSMLPYASADFSDTLAYLDWAFALPWVRAERKPIDVARVREVLDEDHFGISYVKERIVEYLSVLKLKRDFEGPVMCIVGPTGTGKTSLAESIAEGLRRKFVEVSLESGAEEADILGMDRNYVEARPGKIVQALREAGTPDPVLVLDGIDGLTDEEDRETVLALCEVFDPRKRHRFVDRFLGFPFDLSRVLFICTASVDYDIPYALEGKLDLVHLAGYTGSEKLNITIRHLLPSRIKAYGLDESDLSMSNRTLRWLIHSYTREAGLKQLTTLLNTACRRRAAEKVAGRPHVSQVGRRELKKYLGPPRYPNALRKSEVGVATGLAWTSTGGDLLIIEALKMRGEGELIATGQLGQVMAESIKAAHSYVRSRADILGISARDVEKCDIHIHFPEGGVPKDGPSAGVAATLAIASILSGRPIRSDVAVTGEVTLTGNVLAVGGIREKIMAAYRAGLHKLIMPKQNEEDLVDVPEDVLSKMELIKIERMDEALKVALLQPEPAKEKRSAHPVHRVRKRGIGSS
jgi:ATP-dependent Lon protease